MWTKTTMTLSHRKKQYFQLFLLVCQIWRRLTFPENATSFSKCILWRKSVQVTAEWFVNVDGNFDGETTYREETQRNTRMRGNLKCHFDWLSQLKTFLNYLRTFMTKLFMPFLQLVLPYSQVTKDMTHILITFWQNNVSRLFVEKKTFVSVRQSVTIK